METAATCRQLVICCDGTNNTLTGGAADTNVLQLYHHLNRHPPASGDVLRTLYYDPGVGTPDALPPTDLFDWLNRTGERISGLASGRGVYDNIAEAYLFLMRNWRGEQDHIYLFGFSRGAFTVRCVAGMVNLFGIVRPEHEALVPTLIRIYFSLPSQGGGRIQKATRWMHGKLGRKEKASVEVGGHAQPDDVPSTREMLARQVRDLFTTAQGRDAWVHWVGVWDTVESVGLPGPLSRSNPSTATLRGKRIRHVRHALALDEHRWAFEPRIYEEPGNIDGLGQSLKQVWYPGVHCDAGGSYHKDECGLSDAALTWMVDEAAGDLGVPPMPPSGADFKLHDPLWDTPWWALAGMTLRDMQPPVISPANPSQTVPMTVIPAPLPDAPMSSVWQEPRSVVPLLAATFFGLLFLIFSGWCLSPSPGWQGFGVPSILASLQASSTFALHQLQMTWAFQGFGSSGAPAWLQTGQPGWAMFWDLGFIGCWAYLVARIASRSFAWMAGRRTPASPMPWWRWFGMAPLMAVAGDVCEDLLTLGALALHGMGTDILANIVLWLAGPAAIAKWLGLLACGILLLVRLRIVFDSGMPSPPPVPVRESQARA